MEETIGFLDSENLQKKLFSHFWESIKFAFSVAFEAISTDMNLVFVGMLHNTVGLSAYTSWVNYMFLVYSAGVGTSILIRTRTSYLIGKGEKQDAKRFFFWNMGLHTLFGLVVALVQLIMGGFIASLYTSDPES